LQSHDNVHNNIIDDDDDGIPPNDDEQSRRSFLSSSLITTSILFGSSTSFANARGLVRFPCKEPLLNTYHFMRCGLSELEIEDIWSTNPLFLTNREAALSDLGDEQVREACRYIKEYASQPTVVRYSLAAASIDSANIVGDELKIGRDRLVPEFNYMDPRAIGGWDGSQLNATEEAVWAMDVDEGGPNGKGGKPPSNEDGTPAETLSNQVVRLTNLMSVLETLYRKVRFVLAKLFELSLPLFDCLYKPHTLTEVTISSLHLHEPFLKRLSSVAILYYWYFLMGQVQLY